MKEIFMTIKEGYTRVTEILRPFSGMGKIDPAVLKNAGSRGTAVHRYIDSVISNEPLFGGIEEDVRAYTNSDEHFDKEMMKIESMTKSFELWNFGKNFIKKPERFYCDELKITGDCDQIYQDDEGNFILVDFKTSCSEGSTWFLQGSAYSYLAKLNKYQIDRIEFVKLLKNGKAPKVYVYEENMDLFRCCLRIYREFFENPKEQIDLDYL
jgi:hypothetical protein